jgi:hypothetical protein
MSPSHIRCATSMLRLPCPSHTARILREAIHPCQRLQRYRRKSAVLRRSNTSCLIVALGFTRAACTVECYLIRCCTS